MSKKPITWIGIAVILASGLFSVSGLLNFKSRLPSADTQPSWLLPAIFCAAIISLGAASLWYYFNEKN